MRCKRCDKKPRCVGSEVCATCYDPNFAIFVKEEKGWDYKGIGSWADTEAYSQHYGEDSDKVKFLVLEEYTP